MGWVASASSKRRLAKERFAFVESWACWRDACDDLLRAYSSWRGCLTPQRALAFANYRAALDREEYAARVHADSAERLRAASEGFPTTTGMARRAGPV
jgi:hypothetical protein